MPDSNEFVGPYLGDPQIGHLSTPISDSGFTRAFIGNLPAYREGVSPLLRGLEIGLAHGYFLVGPWTLLGPLRDYAETASLGGLLSAVGLIIILTGCLSIYGLASFPKDNSAAVYATGSNIPHDLRTSQGWSQFTGGFFVGATGGAFVAFFLLENFGILDAMIRGLVNT
ncbi:MAG: photosystem I reaction center protein subunit XI [Cyanobacteria bacterium P01_H01_bin.15]